MSRSLARLVQVLLVVSEVVLLGSPLGALAVTTPTNSPAVVRQLFTNLLTIKAASFNFNYSSTINGTTAGNPWFQELMTGELNQTYSYSSFTLQPSITLSGQFDYLTKNAAKLDASLNAQMPISHVALVPQIAIQSRYLDGSLYGRVNTILPLTVELQKYQPYFNLWIRIFKPTNNIVTETLGSPQEDAELAKVKEIFKRSPLITLTKDYGVETVSGAQARHYAFVVNKSAPRQFYIDTEKAVSGQAPTKQDLTRFDTELKGITFPQGELWIGVADSMPYKLVFKTNKAATKTYKVNMTGVSTLTLTNINTPVTLSAPNPFRELEDVIKELYPSSGTNY